MSQEKFEETNPKAKTAAEEQSESLFNRVIDTASAGLRGAVSVAAEVLGTVERPVFVSNQTELKKALGLPQMDLTGFEQEAPYHSEGTISNFLHGLKHLVSKDETLGERLHKFVENKMSDEERKKFDGENKALEDYRHKVIGWSVTAMVPPPPFPR
ncbi:MAG: hypothetical protein K2X27_07130 [Candidatus Obscuribacterales bacterium]|nr:hypothetical protein [Candidatus Obscuribacterales bacterium]